METSGDTTWDNMVPKNSNEGSFPSMENISIEKLESLSYLACIRSGYDFLHVVEGQHLIQCINHIIPTDGVGRTMRPREVHDLGKGTYGRL